MFPTWVIVVIIVVVLIGVVLGILMLCTCADKKPKNTVQPKPNNRDPEKVSTNENNSTPKKKTPRAQPRPQAGAEASPGASINCREESDVAVSRTDIELQESSKCNKRPMPSIPQGHDSKGRGLSANFDDDHPMIGIDAPAKKAGALQSLNKWTGDQEPRQMKKKKKKSDDYNE